MIKNRIGYVYKIIIHDNSSLNGYYYIGKRQKPEFDLDYYGSGKIIRDYLKNHSKDNLEIKVLEWCYSAEELNQKEKLFIQSKIDDKKCLNIAQGGTGGNTFSGLSDEEKKKRKENLSKAQRKIWDSRTEEEKLERVKNTLLKRTHWGNGGKKFSDEWKKRISEGQIRFYEENPERAKEISEKAQITKSTEEYKKKLHDSRVKMWQNPEYRKKRSEIQSRIMKERFLDGRLDSFRFSQLGKTPWNKGKTLSKETKRKLSDLHKGKKLSEETKEKLRQRAIEQWKRQKGEL